MINLSRRRFLFAMPAPLIVAATSIMPVKALRQLLPMTDAERCFRWGLADARTKPLADVESCKPFTDMCLGILDTPMWDKEAEKRLNVRIDSYYVGYLSEVNQPGADLTFKQAIRLYGSEETNYYD